MVQNILYKCLQLSFNLQTSSIGDDVAFDSQGLSKATASPILGLLLMQRLFSRNKIIESISRLLPEPSCRWPYVQVIFKFRRQLVLMRAAWDAVQPTF